MARPKEFVPEKALDKAMNLFWKQGYEASSVEDIIQCTGLGRGSLYDTFGDKHALYLKTLDFYSETNRDGLADLVNQTGSAREILESFFQNVVEVALTDPDKRGCFMVNAAIEMAPHDPEVAKWVQSGMDHTLAIFYRLIIKAQAASEIPWTADPHQLANFLLNTLLGLRVLSRASASRKMLEDSVKTALSIFS